MNRLLKNDSAVSPIIGVLLMIALTTMLSAGVFVIANSFLTMEKTPISAIKVTSNRNVTTGEPQIVLTHMGGDRLTAGDWEVSIVATGQVPSFRKSTTDFAVGEILISRTVTAGDGNYTTDNSTLKTNGTAAGYRSGERYDVKIISSVYQITVFNGKVDVR